MRVCLGRVVPAQEGQHLTSHYQNTTLDFNCQTPKWNLRGITTVVVIWSLMSYLHVLVTVKQFLCLNEHTRFVSAVMKSRYALLPIQPVYRSSV